MAHLTKLQKDQLEFTLLREKANLEARFAGNGHFQLDESLSDSIDELSTYDNHPGDIGTEVFERGKDLALNEHAEAHLADVESALERMGSGEYGTCKSCGKPIPFERLQAVPTTPYCFDHAKDRFVSERRPLEEEFLAPPFGRTSLDEHESPRFDGEDAWQIVQGWGNSNSPALAEDPEIRDYNDMQIENDENDGYVEDPESFLATDIYGRDAFVVRNDAYRRYIRSREGEALLEPEP